MSTSRTIALYRGDAVFSTHSRAHVGSLYAGISAEAVLFSRYMFPQNGIWYPTDWHRQGFLSPDEVAFPPDRLWVENHLNDGALVLCSRLLPHALYEDGQPVFSGDRILAELPSRRHYKRYEIMEFPANPNIPVGGDF